MSKKYKHTKPSGGPNLKKVEEDLDCALKKLSALRIEHRRLQTALRLLTSVDKDDLIKAVERIESSRNWYNYSSPAAIANTNLIGTATTRITGATA